MQAMMISERPALGGLSSAISMQELPTPVPKHGEVRVRVQASAINIDDQHLAEGSMFGGFPIAPRPSVKRPWIPGTDLVGVVDAIGPGVEGLAPGQPVFGMRPPSVSGPWAEFCVTRAEFVHPVPDGWSLPECAGLCLGGMVACSIVETLGEVSNRRIVVLGASGGIGTLLVPILAAEGAEVIAVCSAANRELVESLGARHVIDYTRQSYRDELENKKADAFVDLVGGLENERDGRAVTAREGKFITIVGPEKHVGERKLGVLGLVEMVAHILGMVLLSRLRGPRYYLVGPTRPNFASMQRLIVEKGIRPTVDRTVPFGEQAVRNAIAYVASHRARGKVVIRMSGDWESRDVTAT
jgi:NADPH:quinone reductase-like Zn-dependent oxidoreductase